MQKDKSEKVEKEKIYILYIYIVFIIPHNALVSVIQLCTEEVQKLGGSIPDSSCLHVEVSFGIS